MAYSSRLCLLSLLVIQGAGMVTAQKVRMCYFANWATHPAGINRFTPGSLNASLCTHILYAFAHVSADGTDLEPSHSRDVEFYREIVNLKAMNNGLKVLLSVGGAGLQQTQRLTLMASSLTLRTQFIENAILYLSRYGFDGLDLSWQFPDSNTRADFQQLVTDMWISFNTEARLTGKPKPLLTVAAWGNHEAILTSYDPASIVRFVDYFLLMTYDYWGLGLPELGHHSALSVRPQDSLNSQLSRFSVNKTVMTWIGQSVPRDKIVLGLAMFGKTTRLIDSYEHNLGDRHLRTPATPGPFTDSGISLAYYEICQNLRGSGWTSMYEMVTEGAIAYSNQPPNDWVCYDDPRSCQAKAQYALNEHLAGVFFWSVDYDDFTGQFCNGGQYPLLSAVKTLFDRTSTTERTTTTETTTPGHWIFHSSSTGSTSTRTCEEVRCPPSGIFDDESTNPNHLYPNPYNCGQYYQCAGSIRYLMYCPANLVFDPQSKRCEYQSTVGCVPCPGHT